MKVQNFGSLLARLQDQLGHRFTVQALLIEALTHRSALKDWCRYTSNRQNGGTSSRQKSLDHEAGAFVYLEDTLGLEPLKWNERLEFLGDSVLGVVISKRLMEKVEGWDEGRLSKMRACLVNEAHLAKKARSLDLGACLLVSRCEASVGGRERDSILADAFEAVLGAVFLDGGYAVAERVITDLYADDLSRKSDEGIWYTDFKTRLQEQVQEWWRITPQYRLLDEQGPDHCKQFAVGVYIDGKAIGLPGRGDSKKKASQQAACSTLKLMEGFLDWQQKCGASAPDEQLAEGGHNLEAFFSYLDRVQSKQTLRGESAASQHEVKT